MKALTIIIISFGLLQPLIYSINSLRRLSQKRRTLYPLLRIRDSEGQRSFITANGTGLQ